MLKKLFRPLRGAYASDQGFTLIEVLIVVVIVAILAAISVPIYIQYVEGARAADPQATIGSIYNQCKMYRQDNGEYPSDIQVLQEQEYLEIDQATLEQWEFQIIGGPDAIQQIMGTSTERMKGGAGHVVIYDVQTGKFTGYGLPSDQGTE
ncbi:MAG TPA: prepilin-type N-terminal cleavage/methylation domain-containing protein [bacterium]|jgi:prepilin-type N-terminal cleavage/methylation domain-containing protein